MTQSSRRKAVMVDVDGVVVSHPDPKGWSVNLERDLGLPLPVLQSGFFAAHWNDIIHGRANLRDRLSTALAEIAPTISPDRLIDYWFSNDAHVDHRLIDELQVLRSEGVEVHLATVQEHERARYLWEHMGLCGKFDDMHYAAAIGYSKPMPEFYRAIESAVGLPGSSIFFIDDKKENVDAARACGWAAAVWTGRESLRDLMADQRWDSTVAPQRSEFR